MTKKEKLSKNKNYNIIYTNADAVCIDCGTTKENPENGFCINGHDNWLENNDESYRFELATNKFGVTISEIIYAINNNVDLDIKK